MNNIKSYSVGIEINGSYEDVSASSISFTIYDSIHSLYPTGVLKLNDLEGYFLESRIFTIGSKVKFKFGYGLEENYFSFIVNSFETQNYGKSNQLSGTIYVSLIHESFSTSTIKSQALGNKTSTAIRNVFNYSFNSYDIEETKASKVDNLYRPLMNDKDVIEKILVPNAISNNEEKSAYYCFIDLNNNLHFSSFITMFKTSAKETLYQREKEDLDHYNKLYSIFPFSEKLEIVKENLVYALSYIDEGSSEFKTIDIDIANMDFGGYPIYKTEISKKYVDIGIKDPDTLDLDNIDILQYQKSSLLPDKLIVSIPLSINFNSGQTIKLLVNYGNNDMSYSYSNKYLIERVSHAWDGTTSNGTTQMVISNPFPSYPSNSNIEKGLYT